MRFIKASDACLSWYFLCYPSVSCKAPAQCDTDVRCRYPKDSCSISFSNVYLSDRKPDFGGIISETVRFGGNVDPTSSGLAWVLEKHPGIIPMIKSRLPCVTEMEAYQAEKDPGGRLLNDFTRIWTQGQSQGTYKTSGFAPLQNASVRVSHYGIDGPPPL